MLYPLSAVSFKIGLVALCDMLDGLVAGMEDIGFGDGCSGAAGERKEEEGAWLVRKVEVLKLEHKVGGVGLPWGVGDGIEGVEFLLQTLRRELCLDATRDEASRHFGAYFDEFRRRDSESMTSYISREAQVYAHLCQATSRLERQSASTTTDWCQRTREAELEEAFWQGYNWSWQSTKAGSSKQELKRLPAP